MSAKRPPESRATEGSLAQTLSAENDAEVAARRSAGPPPATPPPPVPPALSPLAATAQLGLTGGYERLGKALDLAMVHKRNLIYALFACVNTLFPTRGTPAAWCVSADDVPLVVTDFGGELGGGVKEVLPNAPGEALSVAFLAFCLDRESEAAALPVEAYQRNAGSGGTEARDALLKSLLESAPGASTSHGYDLGAVMIHALLVRAGLSVSYGAISACVKKHPKGGFSGFFLGGLERSLGMLVLQALERLRAPFIAFFGDEHAKTELQQRIEQIREKRGREQAAPPSTGRSVPAPASPEAATPGPPGEREEVPEHIADLRAGRWAAPEPRGADLARGVAELAISPAVTPARAAVTPADAARRPPSRPSSRPTAASVRAAAREKEKEDKAQRRAAELAEERDRAGDAPALQAALIFQCREQAESDAVRECLERAVVGDAAGPAVRFRLEYDVTLPAEGVDLHADMSNHYLPSALQELKGRSPDLTTLVEEHEAELENVHQAWTAASRLVGVSAMFGGVRIWAAAFEVSRGAACIAYIDSRGGLVKECVGGNSDARKIISRSFLLASLDWLRTKHGVKRVFFTSIAPPWITGDAKKKHKVLELGREVTGTIAVRGAFLLGDCPHSIFWPLTAKESSTKQQRASFTLALHDASQTALLVFYKGIAAAGLSTGSLLARDQDYFTGMLEPDGKVEQVPIFGVDECFLMPVLVAMAQDASNVPSAVAAHPDNPAAAYSRRNKVSTRLSLLGSFLSEGKQQWSFLLQSPGKEEALRIAAAYAKKLLPPLSAQALADEALSAARFEVEAADAVSDWRDGEDEEKAIFPSGAAQLRLRKWLLAETEGERCIR